jgi:Trk K+ transport system NAD-binding subunit
VIVSTLRSISRWITRTASTQRIRIYLLIFLIQITVYTLIFHALYPLTEQKPISWVGALFFVIETMTTTGYGDLLPFENQITQIFSMVMIVTGVVMIFMVIPLLFTPYLTQLVKPTPPRRPPHALRDHVVIMGYDDQAKSLIESLMIEDIDVVIVEADEETAMRATMRYRRHAYVIWGEYTHPATHVHAYVSTARYVIVNGDERSTANIVLGIREITDAHIIAVVDNLSFDRYLRYAGAEYVFSPKNSTGKILARHALVTPDIAAVVDVIGSDLPFSLANPQSQSLWLIKIPILPGTRAVNRTIRELDLFQRYNVNIVILWHAGDFILTPDLDKVIDTRTMLFLIGKAVDIASAIEALFMPPDGDKTFAVIAGFGDVGAAAYKELTGKGIECVVVDQHPQTSPSVIGNAEDEEVLKETHLEKAQICIVALNDDSVNIFTTLMARNINPDLKIFARANHAGSVDKLYRAGADFVALQPTIGGQAIAGIVLADHVKILLDLPGGQKVVMKHWMKSHARTVNWLERKSGVRVLGVEGSNRSLVHPNGDEPLLQGDKVIMMGEVKMLKRCIQLM